MTMFQMSVIQKINECEHCVSIPGPLNSIKKKIAAGAGTQ